MARLGARGQACTTASKPSAVVALLSAASDCKGQWLSTAVAIIARDCTMETDNAWAAHAAEYDRAHGPDWLNVGNESIGKAMAYHARSLLKLELDALPARGPLFSSTCCHALAVTADRDRLCW